MITDELKQKAHDLAKPVERDGILSWYTVEDMDYWIDRAYRAGKESMEKPIPDLTMNSDYIRKIVLAERKRCAEIARKNKITKGPNGIHLNDVSHEDWVFVQNHNAACEKVAAAIEKEPL